MFTIRLVLLFNTVCICFSGNLYMQDMYKIGKACSQCPENTCCGRQCELAGVRNDFDGLCSEYTSGFKCSGDNCLLGC